MSQSMPNIEHITPESLFFLLIPLISVAISLLIR